MNKLLKALPLLGLTFFLSGLFFLDTSFVHAQLPGTAQPPEKAPAPANSLPLNCFNTPKDSHCSYDPTINPELKRLAYYYATNDQVTGKKVTPGQIIDTPDGKCVVYRAPGDPSTHYGCIASDGLFHIGGGGVSSQPGVAGGALPTDTTIAGTVTPSVADSSACNIYTGNLGDCLLGIMASLVAKIVSIILVVVAGILYLANYLLGWSTYVTVFQFGNLIGNSEGLLAAWGVLRDVANILLLFGFIFMGISTILNLSHSEYTAKRALPTLIIFALLLNFSLLAAEAVIDVSNAVATSIYMQAGGDCSQSNLLDCAMDKGIGGTVMQLSGVGSAFSASWAGGIDTATTEVVIVVGLTIFLLITAIVLFAAAIMLIIRAVMLGLLMVTSPIGFAGMAIPPLHGVSKLWWKQLISQATFAPVYFLIAFVSLKMMEGIVLALDTSGKTSEQNLAAVFSSSVVKNGVSSNASVGITFALLIGFMVAALMFAKKSSAIGTSFALKSAGRIGGGLAFGTTGFLARNTVGRGAYGIGRGIQNSNFGATRLGQFTAQKFQGVGKASFDARATGATAGLAGLTGSLGTANKGGYEGAVHAREEADKKYAKDMERSQKEKDELAEIDGVGGKGGQLRKVAEENTKVEQENAEALALAKAASEAALVPEKNQINAQEVELETAKEMAEKLKANAQKAQQEEKAGDQGRSTALFEKAKKAAAQVTALQESLDSAVKDYDTKTKTNLSGITSKIENDKAEYEKLKAELEKRKQDLISAPDERRRKFATEIQHGSTLNRVVRGATLGIIGSSSSTGDHHASEAIFKELAKTPEEKRVDRLIDGFNKAAKDRAPQPASPGAPSPAAEAPHA